MTGSYNNNFMIYPNVVTSYDDAMQDSAKGTESQVKNNERPFDTQKSKNSITRRNDSNNSGLRDQAINNEHTDEIVLQADKSAFRNKRFASMNSSAAIKNKEWDDDIDFKKSILHFSWHPKENSIAIAATNNLFIFSAL